MAAELEIEDDFDPIKLGFTYPLPLVVEPVVTVKLPYASADWTPPVKTASSSECSLSSDDSAKTLVSPVIAKDFADSGLDLNVSDDAAKIALTDNDTADHLKVVDDVPKTTSIDCDIADPINPLIKPEVVAPRNSAIRLVRLRRRNGTYRIAVRRIHSLSMDIDESRQQLHAADPQPDHILLPQSPLQTQISDSFSSDKLAQIIFAIQRDPSGSKLPSAIRDLASLISDPTTAVRIANVLRDELELPQLSTNTNKPLLRKTIANSRQALLVELVSALILPTAPPPNPPTEATTDTDGDERSLSLTPTNLRILTSTLPQAFPSEKAAIKAFMSILGGPAYGARGKVVWEGGVGRMVKNEGKGGFRGERDYSGSLHIFVDYSNILFGLINQISALVSATPSLGAALPPRHQRVLSLPAFSLLLRRGRATPPGTLHIVASSPLAQPLDPLVRLGWEVSVLKRVEIFEGEVVDSTATKLVTKPQSRIHEEEGLKRYKEQGVDEILHLKILQTINAVPGKGRTMVVATGDARGGQFNPDGFVGAVREALKRGWTVELWSFKSGLSRAWTETARREGWLGQGKFTIWAMDDWAEQLVEVADLLAS